MGYAISNTRHERVRHTSTALASLTSSSGGVSLAFAFITVLGATGAITIALRLLGIDLYSVFWLYSMTGLIVVYSYFQIPLMVIVFLPALEGVRPQWREATESLGGSTWQYWRYVAGPLLLPSFLGSLLLLFANAFAAYATAAALVSQGSPILPLVVRATFTSEVVLGQANFGKALALAMVVVVAIVMSLYAWLQRRTSRWVR